MAGHKADAIRSWASSGGATRSAWLVLGAMPPSRLRIARRLRRAGDKARDRRDWGAAVQHYKDYLEHPSRRGDTAIWVQLGNAQKEHGDLHRALDSYATALSISPLLADAHLQRGHVLRLLGRPRDALAAYEEAAQIAPAVSALRDRADAARDTGDWALAGSLYGQYLDEPGHVGAADVWVQLGHARKESGDLDGGLRCYEQAVVLAPNIADTHRHRGYVLQRLGRVTEALAAYDKAVRLDPAMELLQERADAARHAGNWSRAAALYDTYLAGPAGTVDAAIWVQLGHARKEMGQSEPALHCYGRAIALAPAMADPHLHRGHLLRLLGRWFEARVAYEMALRLEPGLPDAAAVLGGMRDALTEAAQVGPTPLPPQLVDMPAHYDRAIPAVSMRLSSGRKIGA